MKRILQNYKLLLILFVFLMCGSYTYAQLPIQQFWVQNQSLDSLVWDNTASNGIIDNGSGTWDMTSNNWLHTQKDVLGTANTKWPSSKCNIVIFGGNPGMGNAGTVTLSSPILNVKSISFKPVPGGNFTITGQNLQSCASKFNIFTSGGTTPVIASNIVGGAVLVKSGTGMLVLTGANTYSGATTVNEGTLQIGDGSGTAGSIVSGSVVTIQPNAIMAWHTNNSITITTIPNTISGAGTLLLKGNNSASKKSYSSYTLSATNNVGTLAINACRLSNTGQNNFGTSAIIDIQQLGQITPTGTIVNSIVLEDKASFWDNGFSLGAIRLEGSFNLTGNITLNNITNIVLGDNTGLYSAFSAYNTSGVVNLSGVISGPGNFAMGYKAHMNNNLRITGTNSNTYKGITTVDGQNGTVSLNLMKTGGAVAIAPSNTIWMGSNNVGSQANLRMGDDQNTGGAVTGSARNQWNNQFGAGVVMQFNNTSGNWMRFDLQGTNQILAGINAGTVATPAGAIIQNQNLQDFNPNNPATLTLNGTGTYVYNGFIRDQEHNVNTNKLNLIWDGTGTQTLSGDGITYTGTTIINNGRFVCHNTAGYQSNTTINAAGILEMNVPDGVITGSYLISGSGALIKEGAGTQILSGNNTYSGATTLNNGILEVNNTAGWNSNSIVAASGTTFIKSGAGSLPLGRVSTFTAMQMAAGSTLDVQNGNVENGNHQPAWTNNKGSLNIASGATVDLQADDVTCDALTGSGTVTNIYTPGGLKSLHIGVSNTVNNSTYGVSGNTADFSGTITSNVLIVRKKGTGTQILSGNSTYSAGTTIDAGTLVANSATALGTGGVTIYSGGTLTLGANITNNITVNAGGTLNKNGHTTGAVSGGGTVNP